ncbi:hypothetical protein HAHE_34900 [Haloferula helveola]|uniref:Uncharacterized protein n=1 Tax=Haloferula helveola TaxID=490095 RepID=A0ABM7RH26_9BACT|nr:hypothetical protein HAHE_34900 [Haloferula helveola]
MIKAVFPILVAASLASADEPLLHADLDLLRKPETGAAEAARLSGCDGKEHILTGYRLLRCPQPDGKADIHLLLAHRRFDFSDRYTSPEDYDAEETESLFAGSDDPDEAAVPASFEATLDPLSDAHVMVFDGDGDELRPFGGNNYIDPGYVFDFDGDGILDVAQSTNYGVREAEDDSVEAFAIDSIETESREWFRVIFNWHPRRADDANDWTFECYDDNDDGIPEIAFGPEDAASDEEARKVVFRWDKEKSGYFTDTPHPHVRVMKEGETFAEIAKAGGLGYPLVDDPEIADADDDEGPPAPKQAAFEYRSLKGADDEALAEFFHGKRRADSFLGDPDAPETAVPDGFWGKDPKAAALAFADLNRLPAHRRSWKLAIDDRGDIAPPESGWLVYRWRSAGCYSLSTRSFGLRFGSDEPLLAVTEYNSIGVVGRNRWADQPAHGARLIPLSEKEARFLADTLFWLDRVRSWNPKSDDRTFGSMSTADGFGTLEIHPDEAAPSELISETVWATRSLTENWDADYNRTVAINLIDFLLRQALPDHLGDRWEVAPELEAQSLVTPTDERLKGREGDDIRQQLEETLSGMLEQDGLPASMIHEVAEAAGNEALVELKPELDAILASLPPPGPEDEEFRKLEKRFERDHFGAPLGDEPDEHKQAHERLLELRKARRFDRAAILREPLGWTVEKLQLASNPANLMQAVMDDSPHARWALLELRRTDPEAWAGLLTEQFRAAALEEKRSLIETLAAGRPQAAAKLIDSLTDKQRRDLIIEITDFHLEQEDGKAAGCAPVLMELIRDKDIDYIRRGEAMRVLSLMELGDEMEKEFTRGMIDEVREPQEGKYGMTTQGSAIMALSKLPAGDDGLDAIAAVGEARYGSFRAAIEALHILTKDSAPKDPRLARLIRPRLKKSDGMMNDVFFSALALDLRNLAPEIGPLASEGPRFPDGDGASYSGGKFKGPVGERYHAAREVVALWSEDDPETLGRMWVHFVVAHPFEFESERHSGAVFESLRERAKSAISALEPEYRKNTIAAATELNPIPDYVTGVAEWLASIH